LQYLVPEDGGLVRQVPLVLHLTHDEPRVRQMNTRTDACVPRTLLCMPGFARGRTSKRKAEWSSASVSTCSRMSSVRRSHMSRCITVRNTCEPRQHPPQGAPSAAAAAGTVSHRRVARLISLLPRMASAVVVLQ
jgi:hypothetical protein